MKFSVPDISLQRFPDFGHARLSLQVTVHSDENLPFSVWSDITFLTRSKISVSYKTRFLAPADFTGVFFNHEKFQKSICLRRILWNEIGMGKGTSMSHYRFCDKVVLIRFYVIQILSGLKSFSLLSLHIYTVNDYRQKLCFLFLPAFAYKVCSSYLL